MGDEAQGAAGRHTVRSTVTTGGLSSSPAEAASLAPPRVVDISERDTYSEAGPYASRPPSSSDNLPKERPRSRLYSSSIMNSVRSSEKLPPSSPSRSQRWRAIKSFCGWLVEHRFVVGFMTLLTVWVLLGEDLKLILTNKDMDDTFGALGIICICLFSIEILLSSVGKQDYFLGFFFILDVVSTSSLILDLPSISEALNDQDGSNLGGAEKGRTARVGARSARVVRVIRLIRIAKLYKAVYDSTQSKPSSLQVKSRSASPGEDDEEVQCGNESRVGKKLSDLTIRRVIVLVLSMLICLPLLSPEEALKNATSAQYGADEVWVRFKASEAEGIGPGSYERAMLRFIYFHNWFAGNGDCPASKEGSCPNAYSSHLYWIGMAGSQDAGVRQRAKEAQLRQAVVEEWATNASKMNNLYNYGSFPPQALSTLWGEWTPCPDPSRPETRFGISLLGKTIEGTALTYAVPCYSDLRAIERSVFYPGLMSPEQFDEYRLEFWFDDRPFVRESAVFSILTTVFVCIVLCAAAMLFYNDVNQLVLYPVEEMISKVQAIRDNPLKAVGMAEKAYAKEVERTRTGRGGDDSARPVLTSSASCDFSERPSTVRRISLAKIKKLLACSSKASSEPMETVILEKTIIKLGSLLALGFGEAGAQIIASNIDGSSYGVNVMVPGQRLECVIGHARIQNFSVATEVLQSRVMTFVNQVAEIVHGVVEEHHGAANKNNGDTFLIVWRCLESSGFDLDALDRDPVSMCKLADMSVLSFAKIIGAVHRSATLAAYRTHPGLQNKFRSQYRVHLTCGLHLGWVIEGAVGSEYKIEASYLSPNVEVAINVEEATQLYRVSFLVSEAVVKKCCIGMRDKCRLIDRVLVPGSRDPLELYCVDLDHMQLLVEERSRQGRFGAKQRMKARQYLEAEKVQKPTQDITELFDVDADIRAMRANFAFEFFEIFRMGYQNYAEGEWKVAERFLSRAYAIGERRGSPDGPSAALIDFMGCASLQAPENWKGYRSLGTGNGGSELAIGVSGRTLRYTL